MKLLRLLAAAIGFAFLPLSPPAQAEPGSVLKPETLRAEPFRDARETGNVERGEKVEILKKEGGWVQVKSARGQGWLRMLGVKSGKSASGGSAMGLVALATGRAGTGKVVSTTGVRGLNEEELKAARFDENALRTLESYSVSRPQAQQFAEKGKLKARALDYLPEPPQGEPK